MKALFMFYDLSNALNDIGETGYIILGLGALLVGLSALGFLIYDAFTGEIR